MAPMLSAIGAAALATLSLASAHISMKNPVPFDTIQLKQDRSPLTSEQYPCKFQTYPETERTQLSVGSSCQLSITLDKRPTAKSVFKAFHSIEGGCPGFNQKTSSFQYSLPKSIPDGDAILAWTWFPVSSYAPEMYMNCAPVTVSGGADDESAFDELPDMFVANLGFSTFDAGLSAVSSFLQSTVTQASLLAQGQLPQCVAQGEHVLEFPNPGDSLDVGASAVLNGGLTAPKGQCAGSSSKTFSSSGSFFSGPESSGSFSATILSTAVTQLSSVTGIFAEAPSSAGTTLLTMTSATAQVKTATTAAAATQVASFGQVSIACTDATDGQVICNNESQYGLCNSGNVVFQDVPAGMVCKDGNVVSAQ